MGCVLHGDGVGLFGLLALDRLPFEEAIDRQDAPPLAISLPKRRECPDGLAFSVHRLPSALGILAPVWNEAPAQWIERYFGSLMIEPDHQQVLAPPAGAPGRGGGGAGSHGGLFLSAP